MIPSKPPQSTAGTQREPTGGTLGWELWGRIGGKTNTIQPRKGEGCEESGSMTDWLRVVYVGMRMSSRVFVLSTFPPKSSSHFFPLLKIFIREVLALGRSDPV